MTPRVALGYGDRSMASADPLLTSERGRRLGRYVLERRIASGGMADVYLARQVAGPELGRTVALKVLKSEVATDDDTVRMFLREALVAEAFHHPNLVPVYEVGREGDRLFLAMELVRGVSVATLMLLLAKKGRSIPIPLAARIAADVLDGLAYAHEALGADGAPLNVVHRDVTPQNILIAEDGVVKLVDFGIARAETALGRTQVARVKGKFSYMSPEQWEPGSQPLDKRADLFSLGVSLYEMSTGSARLFKGSAAPELYKAVVIDTIPPPGTRVKDYPDDLARVVMTALERDTSRRWPSARAMRAALGEVMEAHGWEVEAATLAKLVEFALDGQPIETRWERIDAGEIPSPGGDDMPTMVDDAPAEGGGRGLSLLRPASVFPGALHAARVKPPAPAVPAPPSSMVLGSLPPGPPESAYELGAPKDAPAADHPSPEHGPSGISGRMKSALVALALAGWATAAATLGLWVSESHRADALERRLALRNAVAATPAPPPPDPSTVLVPSTLIDASPGGAAAMETLSVAADPTLSPTLATAWARAFAQGPGGTRVTLTPGDARALVSSGRAMVGLFLAAGTEARAATERVVGYDAAAVVVHPSNPVRGLTLTALGELFSGRMTTWRAVRGANVTPRLVLPSGETSALSALRALVLSRATPSLTLAPTLATVADEAAAVRAVAADPSAVAVVSLGAVDATVRALGLAGGRAPAVAPTAAAVRTLRYPLVLAVVLAREASRAPTAAMEGFTALATSPAGQGLLTGAGYVGR